MLQHALYSVPTFAHGYCTDDNARALPLRSLWADLGETSPALDRIATTYLSFLAHALHPDSKRFRDFTGFDRRWLEDVGSEDAHGRALWALGTYASDARDRGARPLAGQVFLDGLAAAAGLQHPRTWAFVLLGIHAYLRRRPGEGCAGELRAVLTERLMQRFAAHTRDDWHWLADDATYDNARLPHALIL